MDIQEARPHEAGSISRVLRASWQAAYRGIVNDAYLDSLKEDHWTPFLEEGLSTGRIHCLVMKQGDSVVGVSVTRKSLISGYKEDGELVCLYLLPGCIGKGWGGQLLHAAEAVLAKQGYTHCALDVLAGNERAIGFYHANGYLDTGTRMEAELGGQRLACLVLRGELE